MPYALTQSLEKDGIEGMLAHYDQLREQYYGSHTYDFTEWTLTFFIDDLQRRAIWMLLTHCNLKTRAISRNQATLGYLAMRKVNPDVARLHANRALQLDETNAGAIRLLQQLDGPKNDWDQGNVPE